MRHKNGFTILEMMIVLSVIALVFLLTLPNIRDKQDMIQREGCKALIEVANAASIMYEIEHLTPPASMSDLINNGYLKESQRRCPNGDMIEIYDGEASIR